MGIPKLLKTADQVRKDYIAGLTKECTGLTHYIDTEGGCQCGYYIDGEATGSFPFVPNRQTRRRLSSFKRGKYVKTKEDIQRMSEEREREQSRREIRERARLSQRQEQESQPTLAVDLLVSPENGEAT
jgi:hypothetical protein